MICSGVPRNVIITVRHLHNTSGSFGELTYVFGSSRACGIINAFYNIFSLFDGLALLELGRLHGINVDILEVI